jgi:peptidoglycan hydrolase CwlO-like protein
MPTLSRHDWILRALAALSAVALILLGSDLTPRSAGDLASQISSKKSAASSLRAAINAESAQIAKTSGGLHAAQAQLAGIQSQLSSREAELRSVQSRLIAARDHLVKLENRLQVSSRDLSANLVARYEGGQPDLTSVILDAHGFSDLLNKINFLRRVGTQDAQVVGATKAARAAVSKQANALGTLEARDRKLTDAILSQRNQVAAIQAALLNEQIRELGARNGKTAQLHDLNSQLATLEKKAAQQAQAAAVSGNAGVGGIAVNTHGMVQPPPGAPAAVAQVIAAGNAIATLPYIWGGGHGSFHASGYDCSGSVSYALAAAGLLSSPLDSTAFMGWGEPGPGKWITVYATSGHAFMVVAGWRFDTVALAETGTRWSQSMTSTAGFVARHPPGL